MAIHERLHLIAAGLRIAAALDTAKNDAPKSREMSIVVTKLEEAQMWLDKAKDNYTEDN